MSAQTGPSPVASLTGHVLSDQRLPFRAPALHSGLPESFDIIPLGSSLVSLEVPEGQVITGPVLCMVTTPTCFTVQGGHEVVSGWHYLMLTVLSNYLSDQVLGLNHFRVTRPLLALREQHQASLCPPTSIRA